MAATTKQRLALSFVDFLNTSLTNGTLSADDKESVEVATSCISDLFKVSAADKAAVSAAVGNQPLLDVFSTYVDGNATPASLSAGAAGLVRGDYPTDAQKASAEALKSQGNAAMAQKKYPEAIELYGKALAIIPGNPIFLSNRAAAFSASKDHASAKADAETAVATDPKYTKAWSRLGLANFALGDHKGSMEAYQKGIEHEGNGGSDAMKKGLETARSKVDESAAGPAAESAPAAGGMPAGMPDLGALAGMLGGGAGGGGIDFGAIMNNPMFAQMAEKFMSDPGMMDNLMKNPKIAEMAGQFGMGPGGAGPADGKKPDIGALMQDPTIAAMAKEFMGGKGPGGPA